MSTSSTGEERDDQDLRAAQSERDQARIAAATEGQRRQEAEAKRDRVLDAAITQAAHRDAAELVARNNAYIQEEVRKAEEKARQRAQQLRIDLGESEEENIRLRRKLVSERKSASNATFSLVIASVLLIAALIAGGAYFFSSQNNATTAGSTGVMPGVVASAATPSRSTDVAAPDRTPTILNVSPAPDVTPAPVSHAQPDTTAHSGSGIDFGGAVHAGADSGNLSGAALGSDGSRPAAGTEDLSVGGSGSSNP